MSASIQTLSLSSNGDDIGIGDLIHTIKRRWRFIAVFTALTTVIAGYYVLTSQPQFTLSGAVYLGDTQSGGGQNTTPDNSFLTSFNSVSDLATQVQLLTSKALVEQAVLETGLNASVVPLGRPGMPFWRWRFEYGEAVNAFAPQAGDVTAQYAVIADPASRGVSYMVKFGSGGHFRVISGKNWKSDGETVLTGEVNQPASGGGLSLILKSNAPNVTPEAGSVYRLSIVPAKALADGLSGGALSVVTGASASSETQLATVQLKWNEPYRGTAFVNQLMQDYIATQLGWNTQSASNTEDFVAGQLVKIRTSMSDADNNLANYQAKTGILNVPANAQAVISQLSQYEVQRTTIYLQQQALQQLVAATAHPANGVNPYLISEANDPVLSGLASNLATAESQLAAQQVQFTDSAPETQIQLATVSKIESAIRSLILNDEALTTHNLANIDAMIASYQDKLKSMPAQSLQVIALTRSSDVLGQLYVLLMQKEEEAEVSKAATIVNTRVVTPAEVPLYATKPRGTITVAAGFLFGLLASITAVLAQRALSGRYQSDDEVRRSVPLRIYGLVPEWPRLGGSEGILPPDPQTPFSEAFRVIRSNLYGSTTRKRPQVVMLTSPGLGDGKTTLACNLAKMIAEDGKRVLLIDADLHQGHVYESLGLAQAPGLTEWLTTEIPAPFQYLEDKNFAVLTSGRFPARPGELVTSPALRGIFIQLRKDFDYIIVDCPPLPVVSDTLSLVKYADLILSVIYIEHTSRRNFALHNEAIRTAGHRRGVIINGVASASGYHAYGYKREPFQDHAIRRIRQWADTAMKPDQHN